MLVALVLAVESAVFYDLIGGRKIAVPKFAAYASAICAVVWCITNFRHFDSTGLWTGIAVGAIMVLNAWRAPGNSELLRPEPTAFTLLALASWLAATTGSTPPLSTCRSC